MELEASHAEALTVHTIHASAYADNMIVHSEDTKVYLEVVAVHTDVVTSHAMSV